MAEPILIWGGGAVGGTIGAYWARSGFDILMVDADVEHVAAVKAEGLAIEGPVDAFSVSIPVVTPDRVTGQYGRMVLAVKAHHTPGAAAALAPHLKDDGFVLSAQNGLNEIVIGKHVGEARTMGAFVNFGADVVGPGRILYGNRGAVVVGELDGQVRERTRAMHQLLEVFEPESALTENIWGFLWGKLAYGAMLFATALNMDSMARNFADAKRFPVWLALGREVMAVAKARGVVPVGFNGFDPAGFTDNSSGSVARESIARLEAFNSRTAKTHSGVWRDLAIRKRKTEVDAQIGIVAVLAHEVGVETPVIRRLVALVHDIEDGRRMQSSETFDELAAVCA